MRLSTVAAVVWLARWQVYAYGRDALVQRTTTLPAPISIPPSQNMDGNDGPWSSFTIRVGTPAQDVRVLISTADSKTWIVLPAGCPTTFTGCPGTRGGTYDNTTSSTWRQRGYFNLGVEENLGLDIPGILGNDTISLGVEGSGGPTLENQILSGIADPKFWLGEFGVNPKRTNFSDSGYSGQLDNGQASYMTTLKEQNKIPSLSFGYTAGAPYQLKGVFGSLTLGGYDSSRFSSNDLSFTFAPDNSRDLVVGIQSITSVDKKGKSYNLLPSGVLAYVDSTVPYLYLPAEACRAFEQAFNLTWDSANNLYPVNASLRSALLAQNPNITFTLGNSKSGGSTINITLPYASFDLQASFPTYPNNTRYFPLRQAANDTQYALGRTFLQEAYLIVDWERSNFSISQCTFNENMQQQLTAIHPLNTTSNSTSTGDPSGPGSGNSSGNGKTIGIAVGVVIVVLILIGGVVTFLLMRRRRRTKAAAEAAALSATNNQAAQSEHGFGKTELDTDNEHARHELGAAGVVKHEATSQVQDLNPDPVPGPGVHIAELRGEGQDVAELGSHHGPASHYELDDPSAAPVELPAESYHELHGSTPSASAPSSMTSTPVMRSTTGSLINRSIGSSPVYRPVGGGRSPSNRPSRPAFQQRMSTMDTLNSDTPSLPSQPSGMSTPSHGPVATSPTGNDTLSPISPVAEGTLRHGGLLSYMRGMGSSHAPGENQSQTRPNVQNGSR